MRTTVRFKFFIFALVPFFSACSSLSGLQLPGRYSHEPVVDHCAVGCPAGGSALTLNREAYSLNNNGETKFANWVAYRITKDTPASNLPRKWRVDPDIPAGQTLSPKDYTGASAALKVDRGHQANLASMGGVADWETLNYLSNITPQKSDLNQGAWAALEDRERSLSKRADVDEVHVLTGPLYERYIGTLPGTATPHTIPSGYWKIIFVGKTPEAGLYAAFIMEQETPRGASYCTYQTSVVEVEKRAGLTVWSNLPTSLQARLKSRPGQLAATIGC